MIGGYQIIDLKGVDLYGTGGAGVTIKDLYDKIEGSRKPILLENLVVNNVEYKNTFVTFTTVSSNFVAALTTVFGVETATGTVITVTDEDLVTVADVVVHGTAPVGAG